LVVPADSPLLSESTLASLVSVHEEEKADVTLLTTTVEDPKSYGRIVRGARGTVQGIVEHKDPSRQERKTKEVCTSTYCFSYPLIHSGLASLTKENQQGEYYLTDLIGWANEREHRIFSVEAIDWREAIGINSRSDLAEATRHMRDLHVQKLS